MNLAAKFIVLDGPEGAGKSTQIALLEKRLAQQGLRVVAARDPGSTAVGQRIRQILLEAGPDPMAMRCEMLLYMAARAQMMAEVILPALAQGKVVICDRFVSSTLAYQLGGDGLSAEEIRAVAQTAIQGRWPDLTVILDMPAAAAFSRLRRPKDRIELRPLDYHEQVRQNFLNQAAADPRGYRVVDAARPPQVVHEEIYAAVANI